MKYILRLVAGLSFLLFATVASSTGNGSLEELLAVARKADKSSACGIHKRPYGGLLGDLLAVSLNAVASVERNSG